MPFALRYLLPCYSLDFMGGSYRINAFLSTFFLFPPKSPSFFTSRQSTTNSPCGVSSASSPFPRPPLCTTCVCIYLIDRNRAISPVILFLIKQYFYATTPTRIYSILLVSFYSYPPKEGSLILVTKISLFRRNKEEMKYNYFYCVVLGS